VGLWVAVVIALFHYAPLLQRDIASAWMVLRTPATLWIFAMTGLFVASLVSIMTYELDRVIALPVDIPVYIFCSLFFPLVAMADALPPRLRISFHRIGGVGTMLILTTIGVVLRLPAALYTPGDSKWAVLGVETVSSLYVLQYSTAVLGLLIARGVLYTLIWPSRLAYPRLSLEIREAHVAVAPAFWTCPSAGRIIRI
jgi:hypothetical protein